MSTPKKEEFKQTKSKCPYREGVMCKVWKTAYLERMICPSCGWNPEEEERRKKEIEHLIETGKFKNGFYKKKGPKINVEDERLVW